MAVEKFNETYETIYDKKDDFFAELEERCANTALYKIKPDSVKFYAGEVKDNAMHLRHIVGNSVKTIPMGISSENEIVWKSKEVEDVGLFIEFVDENGTGEVIIAPVSPLCKLSLGNRSKLSFTGDLTVPVNKLALAALYEDFLKRETTKEELQVICVYGKIQAVMTNVYSPIGHDEFFKMVDSKLDERFGNEVEMRRGYVSHKWSRATWYIGEYTTPSGSNQQKIQLGLSAMDSQTGHSGAVLQPCLFSGRKNRGMLFDDAWYSKHMALSEEGINEALDTVYMTLNDNAQKLVDTIGVVINHPALYAQKLCSELNKLAKQTSTVALPAKTIKSFISTVSGLEAIRSSVTVWDIIEILWDIPETTGASEAHKDGLMKTVSRVLAINHTALDKA